MNNPLVNKSDDGSWAVEWIFPDCRLGFCLDKDVRESGWYVVYGRGEKMYLENGALPAGFNNVLFDLLEKTEVKQSDMDWATEQIKELELA